MLPSEDLEDLNNIQKNFRSIEDYDFADLIKRYDLDDYIIVIIFKNKKELKILSKVNLNNSSKVDNKIFIQKAIQKYKKLFYFGYITFFLNSISFLIPY